MFVEVDMSSNKPRWVKAGNWAALVCSHHLASKIFSGSWQFEGCVSRCENAYGIPLLKRTCVSIRNLRACAFSWKPLLRMALWSQPIEFIRPLYEDTLQAQHDEVHARPFGRNLLFKKMIKP
jgi:hypothetical protein